MSAIVDRIAKLLELSESSNEHEAELAAQRAAEMMAKHQISMLEVQAARGQRDAPIAVEEGRVDAEQDADLSRVENWHKTLLVTVADACGGRAWMRNKGRNAMFFFAGPADSVSTARYLYMSLERQVSRLSRGATRVRIESNAWRRAYAMGVVAKIGKRMRDARRAVVNASGSLALVLVDKQKLAVDAHMAEKGKMCQTRSGEMKRAEAVAHGYVDGDKIDVGDPNRERVGAGCKKLTS